MKPRLFVPFLLAFTMPLQCQTFNVARQHTAAWHCAGHVWVVNSELYCLDARSRQVSKTTISGQRVFSSLPTPAAALISKAASGRSPNIVGLTTDLNGNIYAVDGLHIHVYSSDGKYQRSLTPGINLGRGIAVLDPEHIFVSGRAPSKSSLSSDATVFEMGPSGIEQSFSDVFFKDREAMDDMVLNKESYLALDRERGLLYQLPQALYEIRVFTLNGDLARTIVPPTQYQIRSPEVTHPLGPKSAVMRPTDLLSNIAVMPDGRLAVRGDVLSSMKQNGNMLTTTYDRFVDIYDSSGTFQRRLMGNSLTANGAYLVGFDHISGKPFFSDGKTVSEGVLQ